MNTNELAKRLDVSPKTIRRWIQLFDLQLTKNENGHYVFSEEDVKLFMEIKENIRNKATTKEIIQTMNKENKAILQQKEISKNENQFEKKFNEIFQQLKIHEKKINEKADEVVSYQMLVHRKEIEELQAKIQQLEEKLNKFETKKVNELASAGEEKKKRKGFFSAVLG